MIEFIARPAGMTAEEAAENFADFLVRVDGCYIRANVEIFERHAKYSEPEWLHARSCFEEDSTLDFSKKWDGCTEITVNSHVDFFRYEDGAMMGNSFGLIISAADFFADEFKVEDRIRTEGEFYRAQDLEGLKLDENLGEGVAPCPQIEFMEVDSEKIEADRLEARKEIEGMIVETYPAIYIQNEIHEWNKAPKDDGSYDYNPERISAWQDQGIQIITAAPSGIPDAFRISIPLSGSFFSVTTAESEQPESATLEIIEEASEKLRNSWGEAIRDAIPGHYRPNREERRKTSGSNDGGKTYGPPEKKKKRK